MKYKNGTVEGFHPRNYIFLQELCPFDYIQS